MNKVKRKGGPTDFERITPEEMHKRHPETDLKELKKLAEAPDKECCNCSNPAWKYAGLGMCFPCTTGESDASEDYELI